jgi:D-tyrosyl-tRNA(Tyr) deacylase
MIGLLQRVARAWVEVDGQAIAAIDTGLLVLLAVERGDGRAQRERLLERLLGYRMFDDAEGKMNLNVVDIGGGVLLVPQFTLAADTRRGMRPSFSTAAPPEVSARLFDELVASARARHSPVHCGRFGQHMQVGLINDGPVTFWLRVSPAASG